MYENTWVKQPSNKLVLKIVSFPADVSVHIAWQYFPLLKAPITTKSDTMQQLIGYAQIQMTYTRHGGSLKFVGNAYRYEQSIQCKIPRIMSKTVHDEHRYIALVINTTWKVYLPVWSTHSSWSCQLKYESWYSRSRCIVGVERIMSKTIHDEHRYIAPVINTTWKVYSPVRSTHSRWSCQLKYESWYSRSRCIAGVEFGNEKDISDIEHDEPWSMIQSSNKFRKYLVRGFWDNSRRNP